MHKRLTFLLLSVFAICLVGSITESSSTATSTSPVIVAKLKLTGQSVAVPSTTVFTPTATGLYRISSYLAVTSPGAGDGAWSLLVDYTDEAGAEEISLLTENNNAAPPRAFASTVINGGAAPYVFHAVAGTPVNYSVAGNSEPSGTYELFLTIERIM